MKQRKAKLIQGRDVGLGMIIAMLTASAMVLPERRWPDVAHRIAEWRIRRRERLSDDELATIQAVVGERSREWVERQYWPTWLAYRYLSWLQLLAVYPPRAWRPNSRLEGNEHIEHALAAGRGAILWTAPFAFNDLFTKVALANAGYQASLLRRPSHGFSDTEFGRRFLNPLYVRIERRFLRDDIVLIDGQAGQALDELKGRLSRNELIIVYAVPIGRRIATRSMENGELRLATGALSLACNVGAAVLPVFTVRRVDGETVTQVSPALPMQHGKSRAQNIDRMLDHYVPLMGAKISCYPDQLNYSISQSDGEMLIQPHSTDFPALQATSVQDPGDDLATDIPSNVPPTVAGHLSTTLQQKERIHEHR